MKTVRNDNFAFYPVKQWLCSCKTPCERRNDENGGCRAGKGMVYQKHGFVFLEHTLSAPSYFRRELRFEQILGRGCDEADIGEEELLCTE